MFYKKTLGGENVGKLYYRDGWRGAETALVRSGWRSSPTGAKPGDVATIGSYAPSPDGRHRRARILGGGRGVLGDRDPIDVAKPEAAARDDLSLVRPARLDAGQQSLLYDMGKVTRHQEPRDRAQPQDPAAQAGHRRSRPTSTSSATRAIPTSESPPRNSRWRSSTSRIPTTSSAMSAPCRTRCVSSTRRPRR